MPPDVARRAHSWRSPRGGGKYEARRGKPIPVMTGCACFRLRPADTRKGGHCPAGRRPAVHAQGGPNGRFSKAIRPGPRCGPRSIWRRGTLCEDGDAYASPTPTWAVPASRRLGARRGRRHFNVLPGATGKDRPLNHLSDPPLGRRGTRGPPGDAPSPTPPFDRVSPWSMVVAVEDPLALGFGSRPRGLERDTDAGSVGVRRDGEECRPAST
jgi:hypothetical protein